MKKIFKILSFILAINIFVNTQSNAWDFTEISNKLYEYGSTITKDINQENMNKIMYMALKLRQEHPYITIGTAIGLVLITIKKNQIKEIVNNTANISKKIANSGIDGLAKTTNVAITVAGLPVYVPYAIARSSVQVPYNAGKNIWNFLKS